MRVLDASGQWTDVHEASADLFSGSHDLLSGGLDQLLGQVRLVEGPDGRVQWRSFSYMYRANPWLWAVVQTIARGLCRLPLKTYRQRDDDASERVRPGVGSRAATLARALRRPGHGMSRQALWHATTVDRLVNGNAVWFPQRAKNGNYLGFQRVPWKHARFETIAGEVRYWDSRTPKVKRLADDVVHFGANLDCDDLANPSPIESLRATLALHDAVERHLLAYFRNSARPAGHVKVDKNTPKETRDWIREELTKLYTAPENAGKVLITSGEWSSMTGEPGNSKVIELSKQSREEICAAYQVPPPLVGILDRAIMSNVRELRSHYVRDVVGPHGVIFEGDIDAQVIARDDLLGDIYVEFEDGAMLRPDLESRSKTWKDQRYLLTLNEMRELENRPRIDHPSADVPWMPLNEAPLGADDNPESDKPKPPDTDPDNETDDTTGDHDPMELVAAIQKVYLGVGVVLTAQEARELLNRMGADLEDLDGEYLPPKATDEDDDSELDDLDLDDDLEDSDDA